MVSIKGYGEVDWDLQRQTVLSPMPQLDILIPGFAFKFKFPGVEQIDWFKMTYDLSWTAGTIETFPNRPRGFVLGGSTENYNQPLRDMDNYLARLGFPMSGFINEVRKILLASDDKTFAFIVEVESGPYLYLTIKSKTTVVNEPTQFITAMARKLSIWLKQNWKQSPPCALGDLPRKEFVISDREFQHPLCGHGYLTLKDLPVRSYAIHMAKFKVLEHYESALCEDMLRGWVTNGCVVVFKKEDFIQIASESWDAPLGFIGSYTEALLNQEILKEVNGWLIPQNRLLRCVTSENVPKGDNWCFVRTYYDINIVI